MRIRLTERRERRFKNLCEATGKGHKSQAIDQAADYYLRMSGDTLAFPGGALEELMETAVEQGSVTPAEIAGVLDCEELPVEYESEWSVNGDSE